MLKNIAFLPWLYSIKFGVASCKNQTFAHGKLMITYAEDEIINEK